MQANGSGVAQITHEPNLAGVALSSDGRYIALGDAGAGGTTYSVITSAGGGRSRLVSNFYGGIEAGAGDWLLFPSVRPDEMDEIPLLGGKQVPIRLPGVWLGWAAASPDKRWLAIALQTPQGPRVQIFPWGKWKAPMASFPYFGPIGWTPDSKALLGRHDAQVWLQSIAGGAERQITHFTGNMFIGGAGVSPDGRLAVERFTRDSEAVVLRQKP